MWENQLCGGVWGIPLDILTSRNPDKQTFLFYCPVKLVPYYNCVPFMPIVLQSINFYVYVLRFANYSYIIIYQVPAPCAQQYLRTYIFGRRILEFWVMISVLRAYLFGTKGRRSLFWEAIVFQLHHKLSASDGGERGSRYKVGDTET